MINVKNSQFIYLNYCLCFSRTKATTFKLQKKPPKPCMNLNIAVSTPLKSN